MFRGVFTPMVTLFDAQGQLDLEANRRMVRHLIDGGVDGILILGSIGEFFAVSAEEKRQLIDTAIWAAAGRVPILVGTGGTQVSEVIGLSRYAQKAGAAAGVAISPYYFKLDQESLYRYYAEIARSVDWPLVLYNFPDRTAVELGVDTVLRLARDFPNVVGIKDTVDSIGHTRALIERVKGARSDFAVLSGYDEYLLPNLVAGGDGLIGGLSNIAPGLLAGVYRAYRENDWPGLVARQRQVHRLMSLYALSQPFVAAIKGAVSLVLPGVHPACRPPTAPLTEAQFDSIREVLQAL